MKHKVTSETTALEVLKLKAHIGEACSSMTSLLNEEVMEAKQGFVKFKAQADGNHLNMMGKVHGGYYATLLDAAMGCAVHTTLEKGEVYATLEMSIKMVKFLDKNKPVIIEGKVVSSSNKISVAEAKMFSEDGQLYALGTSTCYMKRF